MALWRTLVVLGCLALPALAEPVPYGGETVSFRALPAVVDPHPLNDKVHYVGGYEIVAHGTSQVMGLSDLQLTPQGDGFHVDSVSDLGAMVGFDLRPDGQGGFRDSKVTIDLLRDVDGKTSINRDFNDAEDIAQAADGTRYVSFERFQRVMAYWPGAGWHAAPVQVAILGVPQLPNNEGLEGMAVVGGRLLLGAESGGFWSCDLRGGCQDIAGPPVPGFLYKLSSLAPVPGHDDEVLALYRYYEPFNGPHNVLSLLRVQDGRLVKVSDLAKIAAPLPSDNYEGVAAVPVAGGYRLYLISDSLKDDGKPRLLMFDWHIF